MFAWVAFIYQVVILKFKCHFLGLADIWFRPFLCILLAKFDWSSFQAHNMSSHQYQGLVLQAVLYEFFFVLIPLSELESVSLCLAILLSLDKGNFLSCTYPNFQIGPSTIWRPHALGKFFFASLFIWPLFSNFLYTCFSNSGPRWKIPKFILTEIIGGHQLTTSLLTVSCLFCW